MINFGTLMKLPLHNIHFVLPEMTIQAHIRMSFSIRIMIARYTSDGDKFGFTCLKCYSRSVQRRH